jgi:hypothetical protein
VGQVLLQHNGEVDQHPVGDFRSDGQHKARGLRFDPRTAWRDLGHSIPASVHTASNDVAN